MVNVGSGKMDSYIEVTLITNLLIGVMMFYGSGCYTRQCINHMFFLLALFIEQVLLMLSLYISLWHLFWLYQILFYLIVFRYAYKRLFLFLCLRYLAYFTLFKFSGGSFHLGHYFVPINNHMIGIWILFIFIIITLKQKWEAYLIISEFIFPLTIYADKPIRLLGFLDSGNQVTLNGLPVLFLDMRYRMHINTNQKNVCDVCTLNDEEKLSCYLYEVKIGRNKKRSCYICCDKKVTLEWGCRCLLNLYL